MRRNRFRTAVFVVLVIAASLSLLYGLQLIAQHQYGDTFSDCDYRALPGQSMQGSGVSLFPIGLSCDWTDPQGEPHSGIVEIWWTTTFAVYGGLLVLLVGVVGRMRFPWQKSRP